MIPKIIHYCWFGGAEKSPLIKKCIGTWKKIMPDYEIKEWNESCFDIESVPFVCEAKAARKWAFMADYVRLYAMYHEGGIYMDTDVKVMKRFDDFLYNSFFTCQESHPDIFIPESVLESGHRNPAFDQVLGIGLCSAVMGSEKGCPYLKDCLDYYNSIHFEAEKQTDYIIVNLIAKVLENYGYRYVLNEEQHLRGNIAIYKPYVFAGQLTLNENSYAQHLYNGSWVESNQTLKHKIRNQYPFLYTVLQQSIYSIKDRLKKKIHIGVLNNRYAFRRLILGADLGKYVNIRLNNWYFWLRLPKLLLMRLGLRKRSTQLLYELYYEYSPIIANLCTIMHSYSAINYSTKEDWVLSIESCVPYSEAVTEILDQKNPDFSIIKDNKEVERALKCCARKNCKRIIAISQCTYNIQKALLDQFPKYKNAILQKTTILHPSQSVLINSIEDKHLSYTEEETFIFTFVGNHLYRKGGREILLALSSLREQFSNFELHLIGDAEQETFHAPMIEEDDIKKTLKLIEKEKAWVHYYPNLPNNQVLDILRRSHVSLLPTWSDSYGFSVLESQASGTPVITTSLRALKELNNDSIGWIIEVPTNPLNHPILYNTREEKKEFQKILVDGIIRCCADALQNRQLVKEKSIKCLQQIKKNHNPVEYSAKLKDIYFG